MKGYWWNCLSWEQKFLNSEFHYELDTSTVYALYWVLYSLGDNRWGFVHYIKNGFNLIPINNIYSHDVTM